MKKIALCLSGLILLASNTSFGQFLSNLSVINPALTGLEDKHFGHLMYSRTGPPNFNSITGIYNFSADNINSGFGVLVGQYQQPWSNASQFGGSYQYTFNLSETVKLAAGTSLSYISSSTRGGYEEVFGYSTREYLKLNFGTALSWNNLNVGVSTTNFDLLPYKNSNFYGGLNPEKDIFSYLNLHAWYDFKIGSNFILSPSIVGNNSRNLSFLNVRGEHFNRVWWTVGYSPEDYISIGAGIRVFNQLHLGYNFNFNVKYKSSRYHNFSLSYRLKK